MERRTIRQIREAVNKGRLPKEYNAAQVNTALGIKWAGTFLPKHAVGNGHTTELFVRVSRGRYRLKR
jgi:hypothetical protein